MKYIIATSTQTGLDLAFQVEESINHNLKGFPTIIKGEGRQVFNISNDPVYMILKTETIVEDGIQKFKRTPVVRINGKASFNQLRAVYLKALNGELNNNGLLTLDGENGGFDSKDGLFNGNGLGFNINIPKPWWLVIGAIGALQYSRTNNLMWLAPTAFSTYQYFKR